MEKQHHINLDSSHGAKYALLPGDPERVEIIAGYLENPKFLTSRREYTSWIGEIKGEKVLVTSTGIGGPSASIAIEELYNTGVRTFIRIGTCGGMQMEVMGGDMVIVTGSIRNEGTTKEYVPIEYPAVADFNVVQALVQAAETLGYKYHTGVVQSKDSYYGQHEPERMPVGYELTNKWGAWVKAGALASEMESAALFCVSSFLRARAGCILNVVWNQKREKANLAKNYHDDNTMVIKTALEAMRILIEKDKKIFYGVLDERRIIESPNITNFRDLGGIPCGEDRVVRPGLFYRSGALSRVKDEDLKIIESFGIKRIIDLRSQGEILREPDIIPDDADYYHYPGIVDLDLGTGEEDVDDMDMKETILSMLKYPEKRMDSKEYMTQCYIAMAKIGDGFKSVFELIKEDPENPMLFHCSAGKDRTGVLGALILLALGAKEEDIFEDYMLSNEYRKEENEIIMEWIEKETKDEEFLENVYYTLIVEEDLLRAFFDTALSLYGDWDTYFREALDLTGEERQRIIKAATYTIK